MKRLWRLWEWFVPPPNNWAMVWRIYPYSHNVEYKKYDLPR